MPAPSGKQAAGGRALLRIHEATVIDEDFGYTGGARTADIKLKAGLHAFRLYFMPGLEPSLDFQWNAGGGALKPLTPDDFCRPAP